MTDQVENVTAALAEVVLDEHGKPLSKKALAKLRKEQEKEQRKAETAARLAAEKAAREAAEPDYSTDLYGVLPTNQSATPTRGVWEQIGTITPERAGERIKLRARLHTSRAQGSNLVFFQLRQSLDTIQAVLAVDKDTISKKMAKFAAG
ncbi:hypothetical protein BC828DRAFT_408531, partial [Blastocladiella britannica]